MRRYLQLAVGILFPVSLLCQNVGIGTINPPKKLSVDGSVLVDAGNLNNATLDSAALRFGTSTGVGLFSNRTGAGIAPNGLDVWTNNTRRMIVTSGGFVGINHTNPSYRLDVGGPIHATSSLYTDLDLYVNGYGEIDGSARIGNYLAVGDAPTSSYRLLVNGNALINTNLGVNGTLRVDGKLTNENKAIMLSNSSTTLRSGFTSGTFSLSLNAGQSADVTFFVTPFTGNNNNIRVSIGQFQPGSGANNWGAVVMTPHSVLATDPANGNGSTVKVRFQNAGASLAELGTNAVLYLYSVVTN